MSGIYIHIPFCKSRCAYCDFHSGTDLSIKKELVDALCAEIELRKNYIRQPVKTIYFGGGTPSILNKEELSQILNTIHTSFNTSQCVEMTLEVNPDNITIEYLKMLQSLQFKRISMGIQSFNDDELRLINRRHSARKAIEAVKLCQASGFNNISIDLIYGLPNQTLESWQYSLNMAIELGVQHISAYHLTYEKGTKISQLIEKKQLNPVSEDLSVEMFKLLVNTLEANAFEQYEISNFAKENFRSRHNSSYWNNQSYLGIGPSAHSYDLNSRQWNLASTKQYISHIQSNRNFFEIEILTAEEKYNDFIITRLRTKEGIDLSVLKEFGTKLNDYCLKNAQSGIKQNLLTIENNHLKLTKEGIFVSDRIFSDLIRV